LGRRRRRKKGRDVRGDRDRNSLNKPPSLYLFSIFLVPISI